MRKHKATFEEHFGQLAQAQFVAQPPQHYLDHDVAGKGQMIERSAGPIVERALTSEVGEGPIAKLGTRRVFTGCGGCAMRAEDQ